MTREERLYNKILDVAERYIAGEMVSSDEAQALSLFSNIMSFIFIGNKQNTIPEWDNVIEEDIEN